jgi:hypothetical protein
MAKNDESPITEEGEAAARAARERFFESQTRRFSDFTIGGRVAETLGRAIGIDAEKVPPDLVESLRSLADQVVTSEPGPIEDSRVPPSGE